MVRRKIQIVSTSGSTTTTKWFGKCLSPPTGRDLVWLESHDRIYSNFVGRCAKANLGKIPLVPLKLTSGSWGPYNHARHERRSIYCFVFFLVCGDEFSNQMQYSTQGIPGFSFHITKTWPYNGCIVSFFKWTPESNWPFSFFRIILFHNFTFLLFSVVLLCNRCFRVLYMAIYNSNEVS